MVYNCSIHKLLMKYKRPVQFTQVRGSYEGLVEELYQLSSLGDSLFPPLFNKRNPRQNIAGCISVRGPEELRFFALKKLRAGEDHGVHYLLSTFIYSTLSGCCVV